MCVPIVVYFCFFVSNSTTQMFGSLRFLTFVWWFSILSSYLVSKEYQESSLVGTVGWNYNLKIGDFDTLFCNGNEFGG